MPACNCCGPYCVCAILSVSTAPNHKSSRQSGNSGPLKTGMITGQRSCAFLALLYSYRICIVQGTGDSHSIPQVISVHRESRSIPGTSCLWVLDLHSLYPRTCDRLGLQEYPIVLSGYSATCQPSSPDSSQWGIQFYPSNTIL